VAAVAASGAIFHATALRPSFGSGALSDAGRSLAELYQGLRRAYDLVIVDCPPILESPYLVRIAQESAQVILVVQAEKTRIPSALRARDEIALAGAQLVGVVLNKHRRYLPRFLDRRL
jgi:Mrp family chromosome partitioning ATPase